MALTVSLALSCQVKTSETVAGGSGSIPYSKIGLNVFPGNRTAGPLVDQMRDISSIGVRYIRVNFWFDTIYMNAPHSSPNFTRFDEMVDAADAAGLEVLGILGPAPAWLTGSGDWMGVFAQKYVTPVVSRYKGRVSHWEVWNEPDGSTPPLDGTPEMYFQLLTAAHNAIKAADPGAKVVAGATVNIVSEGGAKVAWMNRLVDLGLKQQADILNFHYYSGLDVTLATAARTVVERTGLPVWVTETGIIGQDRQLDYFNKNVPYIDKALNPERIYWYCYIQGEGEHEETHPADTYGIVTVYDGQRYESPLYGLLKSH